MPTLNMTLFEVLSPQKFAAERKFFCEKNAGDIRQRFETFVANAIGHAMVHGDPTHCNNVLLAAKAVGQYRFTKRVLTPLVSPWEYDTESQTFVGKADKAKLNRLRGTVEVDGVEIPRWEQMLAERLRAEDTQEKKAAEAPFDLDAEIERLIKLAHRKAVKHGYTEAEADKCISKKIVALRKAS